MNEKSFPKMSVSRAADLLGVTKNSIHRRLRRDDLQCPKLGNKSYLTHKLAKIIFGGDLKKQAVAFHIVKGGTGKTTSIHNISCCASLYGARVLCIDIDPQGNLTDAFNCQPEEIPVLVDVLEKEAAITDCLVSVAPGIDLIPSRIENVVLDTKIQNNRSPLDKLFRNLLKPIASNYDFIFIDCPPMIGHTVTAACLFSDTILVPLNPDKFSAKGLGILREEIERLSDEYERDVNYKVFLNKFSGNTILSDKAIQTIISEESERGNALSTAIRMTQEVPNSVDSSMNLFSTLKNSTSKDDFDALTRELLGITPTPSDSFSLSASKKKSEELV